MIIAKLKQDGSIILWGPEAKLMRIALTRAWAEFASDLMGDIFSGFDLTGEVSVDRLYIEDAFIEYADIGSWVYVKSRDKLLQSLALVQKRSIKYFKKQAKAKADIDALLAEYLEAMDVHFAEYMAHYPEEVLLPEIEKAMRLAEMPPGTRTVDVMTLKDRVKALQTVPSRQFGLVTDIDAGRAWQHSGIIYGDQTNATTYQVLAERDRRTCPVCRRLDGTTYSVPRQMEKIEQFVESAGDVNVVAQLYRFPRFQDVDNRSPAELRDMDLMPPFHGNCRCEISIIY